MLLLCRHKEYTGSRKFSMDRYELTSNTEPSEIHTHFIDYSSLVDTVQLSTARLLDIPGAMGARSFAEILADKTPDDRERIIWEVGGHFDEELISFVAASLIRRRHQQIVILADESEGINGNFPWEPKLKKHIRMLKDEGILNAREPEVVRYSTTPNVDIENTTEQAQSVAA